jgi:hypothetical protein
VTDAQPPRSTTDPPTEVIPPAISGEGIARTRELPVVEDAPTVVAEPPAGLEDAPHAPDQSAAADAPDQTDQGGEAGQGPVPPGLEVQAESGPEPEPPPPPPVAATPASPAQAAAAPASSPPPVAAAAASSPPPVAAAPASPAQAAAAPASSPPRVAAAAASPPQAAAALPPESAPTTVSANQPDMVAPPNAVAPPDADAPPDVVAPPAHAGASSRPLVAFAVVAVLVVALVLGLVALNRRGSSGGTASGSSSSSSSSAVALPGTISSVDPSGGSGFRRDGSSWRTQTYTSADFGNLKDGVGMLLDLGSARTVSAVTFDVVGGPIAVELRAGDTSTTSPSSYDRVVADPSASGSTTLAVKGGAKHRYWLVWVTKLAAQDGGYRAVLSAPQARRPRP